MRPRPNQTAGRDWLPAETVILSESWQPQAGELRVGDPITRSITLRAQGVTGEQLPELDPGQVAGFKVYPDRAQVNTEDLEHTVQGEMSRNLAFVPVTPGRYTLPAVRLHWWDTRTDRERLVELPERSVEVLPALTGQGRREPLSSQTETIVESQIPAPSGAEQTLPQSAVFDNGAGQRSLHNSSAIWPWISLLFGILWLATLGIWWHGRRHSAATPRAVSGLQNAAPESAAKARARFQAACRVNDPKLAQRLDDPQVKQVLNELDRLLYRGSAQIWDGKSLVQALTKLPGSGRALNQDGALPELYT